MSTMYNELQPTDQPSTEFEKELAKLAPYMKRESAFDYAQRIKRQHEAIRVAEAKSTFDHVEAYNEFYNQYND